MPPFNATPEFLASVIYAVVIVLIVDGPCQAIAEHAFREGWQRVDWMLLEELGGGRRVPLG